MHMVLRYCRFSPAPGDPQAPPPARARSFCAATVTVQTAPPPPAVPGTRTRRIPTTTEPTRPTPKIVDPATVSPPGFDSAATAFRDYQSLFVSQRGETASPVPVRTAEGAVPADFPAGTYYLAGPGIFSDDHGSTVHPLDGHGYLRAFDFGAGARGVKYSARYVATGARREERDEATGRWRFTHRGPFSVLKAGKRVGNVKVMKNVANTSVLVWGGRLLCLWEGGDPYELDLASLDTIGLFDAVGDQDAGGRRRRSHRERRLTSGGVVHGLGDLGLDVATALLRPVLRGVFKMPAKRLLSHHKIDARRNRLLMLACNSEDMLLPRSNFTFYEFDAEFRLLQKKDFTIPDHLLIHDWAFTEDHYVLVGNRIQLDVPGSLRALSGHSPMISSLSPNPSRGTSPVYLLPRSDGARGCRRDWSVPVEVPGQMWVLHIGNAFERRGAGDGGDTEFQLQASACSYRWFDFQKMFGYNWRNGELDPSFMNVKKGQQSLLPHLVKISLRMDAEGNCRQCSVGEVSHQPADFPAINPAFCGSRNGYLYAGTASGSRRFLPHFPFDSVAKFNCADGSVATWSAGGRRFVGEPMFVPRAGTAAAEDDGYVLVVEHAAWKRRCYLVILDAKRIGGSDAVVAKIAVPKHLNFPMGFHGFWAGRE